MTSENIFLPTATPSFPSLNSLPIHTYSRMVAYYFCTLVVETPVSMPVPLPLPQLPVGAVDFAREASDEELKCLQDVLYRLSEKVMQRRIEVEPVFVDFDRYTPTHPHPHSHTHTHMHTRMHTQHTHSYTFISCNQSCLFK